MQIATTRRARRRGLLRAREAGGTAPLKIPRCRWVHTFGMRFPILVAYLDADERVVDLVRMEPGRLGRPRLRARHVLEIPLDGEAA